MVQGSRVIRIRTNQGIPMRRFFRVVVPGCGGRRQASIGSCSGRSDSASRHQSLGKSDRSSGSGSGYSGRAFGSHRDFNSVPEQSPVDSDLESPVRRQFDLSRAAMQRGGAADNPLPGSMEASAVEGDMQVFGQSTKVMKPFDELFHSNYGEDMVVTEAVATPPFLGVTQPKNTNV
ncbi:hypothetical protein G3M48_008195 [Beauveria asiatica]|uniref:Uncharacterized protein n=1 Tax=Beauveria asiatica TaxID=1069075 RepID=A0AAW0RKU3_9HYPO